MLVNLILIIIATFFCATFLIFLLTAKGYEEFINSADEKLFQLKEAYYVGFKIIDIFKIDFKSNLAKKIRQDAIILYGEKYADYYTRMYYAQKFTFCHLVLVIGSVVGCLATGTDGLMILGFSVVATGVVYYYYGGLTKTRIKDKSVIYLSEFPNAVSTIALLVNSGMMLREAWTEVAYSSDTELYLQMQKVSEDMENGMAESDALYAFALRCATPEIKKFTSFIVQGLEKGNKDLTFALKNQSNELWEEKKQSVLQQGELAASKLLIPIMIMFIGILIMVMGPIMSTLGM